MKSRKPPIPVVRGTSILTEEQIRGLSEGSLNLYYQTVKRKCAIAHDAQHQWCCSPRGPRCEVVRTSMATPRDAAVIKAFDYAYHTTKREVLRRRALGVDI